MELACELWWAPLSNLGMLVSMKIVKPLATKNSAFYNPPPFFSLPPSLPSPFPFRALRDLASFYLHAAVESGSVVSFVVIWDVSADAAVPVIPFWARAVEWNTAEQSIPGLKQGVSASEEKSFALWVFAFPHRCIELVIFWPGAKLAVGYIQQAD